MKGKAINIFVLFHILCLLPLAAQRTETLRLRVRVLDSFTREAVRGATLTVCGADSTTVLCPKMWGENFGLARYGYRADVERRPVYVVQVKAEGYDARFVRIVPPGGARRQKEWEAEQVLLRKNLDRTLGEAKVTATRVAMVVKGDTIEYDARAFRLAEGSMLDNLISMLPGASLTPEGEIFIGGEKVSRLMVNGRDFFRGNPKVALDNLPAYAVDKIRAYHEGPTGGHLLDAQRRQSAKGAMVVDVRLKREYAQGWMANVELAGGSKTRGGWQNVYLGRLFATRFTDHSSLGLYGMANNLGDNQSPGRKGQWKKVDAAAGERRVKLGGATVEIDGKRTGTVFSSSVEARREDTYLETRQTDMTAEALASRRQQTESQEQKGRTDVKWKARIETKSRLTYFCLEPYADYRRDRRDRRSDKCESLGTPLEAGGTRWEDVYTRAVRFAAASDVWTAGLNLSGMLKSPLSGEIYDFTGSVRYRGETGDSRQHDRLAYAARPGGWQRQWRDDTPGRQYEYAVDLRRNLLERLFGKFRLKLTASYGFRQTFESGHRLREEAAEARSDDAPVAAGAPDGDWAVDLANSFHTVQHSRRQQLSLLSFMGLGPFHLNSIFEANFTGRTLGDLRAGAHQRLQRRDAGFYTSQLLNFLPWNLMFRYVYRQQLPDMLRLLDVRDGSDPLNLYVGNAALRRTSRHHFRLFRTTYSSARQRTCYAALDAELIGDAVTQERLYDPSTGVTRRRPVNIDGCWWGEAELDYGQTLDAKNRLSFESKSWFRFNHSVDLSADAPTGGSLRSEVDNYRFSQELSLAYRTLGGLHVGAKGRVEHLVWRARPQAFRSERSTDFSYGLTLTVPLGTHFGFETDMMAYARRGYSSAAMNETQWVWNAALSCTFGPGKAWLVRAVGFDLLHQLSGVRREINAQGYVETWHNTMPSYATLHLVYRLNVKPRGKSARAEAGRARFVR